MGKMPRMNDREIWRKIALVGKDILASEDVRMQRTYMQHGRISVYRHCLNVTYMSLYLARKWNVDVEEDALIRGALLHDYFLYDWHEKDESHKWHGFIHAQRALENARRDFPLQEVEMDIIANHMFPLNLFHIPRYKESVIVCIADKICALDETVFCREKPFFASNRGEIVVNYSEVKNNQRN